MFVATVSSGVLVVALALLATPQRSFAAGSGCSLHNTVVYTVAHEDDSLLFQSPDLLHDIQNGDCVRTVFMTAGDAGQGSTYWLGREQGALAAYATMAGVSDTWAQSDAGVAGRSIPLFTLSNNPKISVAFLRLPDGGVDGSGFGHGSMQQLWTGATSTLSTVDGLNTYSKQDIVNTLATLLIAYQPSRINTQDFVGTFGGGDHSDHYATGLFTQSAQAAYPTPHTLYGYVGYLSALQPANVFGADLAAKIQAFFAYTPFDTDACQNYASCGGAYDDWLNRQYYAGSQAGGTVDQCPNLDGMQTTIPNGYQLNSAGNCVPNPNICESVVSDTTDLANGLPVVAAFVSPLWTAGANIPGATWIWNAYHVTDPANGETVTFSKTVFATTTPTNASIVVAADDTFTASLNGTQFASSSAAGLYLAGNEQTYDVTALMHAGSNTLTFAVHNMATGDTNPELNPAGLRYKLDITEASCVATSTATSTPVVPAPTPAPTPAPVIFPIIPPVSGGGGGILSGPLSFGYHIPAPVVAPTTPTGQVLGASAYNFTVDLSLGSNGAAVTALQQLLLQGGFYNGPITGYFGPMTLAAVKKFQIAHKITPANGYVGPTTRTILNQGVTPKTANAGSSTPLTAAQIQSLVLLLQSLGADATTINIVNTALSTR